MEHAFGSKLKIAGSEVAKLTNVGTPNLSRADIKVTNHQSPDKWEEYLPGLREGGEIPVEGFFEASDTTGQIALYANFTAEVTAAFEILTPDEDAGLSFNGYVKSIKPIDGPLENAIPFAAVIKVTGAVSFDLEASANITTIAGIEEEAGAALTLIPTFAGGTYLYTAIVNTASDWIKLTVTGAGVLKVDDNTVTSTFQTGELALGAAGTVTEFVITTKETGKVMKTYKLIVTRP